MLPQEWRIEGKGKLGVHRGKLPSLFESGFLCTARVIPNDVESLFVVRAICHWKVADCAILMLPWQARPRFLIKPTPPRVQLPSFHMGGCQNYGPFLGPCYNTAPNI